jgi:hypothetical protein
MDSHSSMSNSNRSKKSHGESQVLKIFWWVLITGADASDYFNYGFDEFTWAAYCTKQTNIRKDFNPGNVMAVRLPFLGQS